MRYSIGSEEPNNERQDMKRIRVYAGVGFRANGTKIGTIERVHAMEEIRTFACNLYGGVTFYRHTGAWKDGDLFVTEDGVTIEVLTNDGSDGKALAFFVKDALYQKSVVMTCEEVKAEFI